MCVRCDDETAYNAHMDYLDSMQTQGRDAVSGVATCQGSVVRTRVD